MEKTLSEMESNEFLTQVDEFFDELERLSGDGSSAKREAKRLQTEIRRRISKNRESEKPDRLTAPIRVEVSQVDIEELVRDNNLEVAEGVDFHATPFIVTVVGPVTMCIQTISHAFCTSIETEAFLVGLETARRFGLPFDHIPDIDDIPKNGERFCEGAD